MNASSKTKSLKLGEEYQVKVQVADGWRNQKVARLHISVGQEYHEGDKFQATMDWAKENFDQVIICVNDTLQRHNYIFQGKSPEEAHRISKENGEKWIEKNTTPEMRVDSKIKIVRWDDWMQLDNYDEILKKVRDKICADNSFGDAIEVEALNFWKRIKERRNLKSDRKKEDFLKHSRNYLLEECAVFSMMFEKARLEDTKTADIYPGSTLIPCHLFKPNKVSLRGFTRIKFKVVSSLNQSDTVRDDSSINSTRSPIVLGRSFA